MTELTKKYYDKLEALKGEWYKSWINTEDEKELEGENSRLTIAANYATWKECKEEYKNDDIMYVEITDWTIPNKVETVCTALTLEQMIMLKNYLEEKIEYLEA